MLCTFVLSVSSLFWSANDYPPHTAEQAGLELDSALLHRASELTGLCVQVVHSNCLAISRGRKLFLFLVIILSVSLFSEPNSYQSWSWIDRLLSSFLVVGCHLLKTIIN